MNLQHPWMWTCMWPLMILKAVVCASLCCLEQKPEYCEWSIDFIHMGNTHTHACTQTHLHTHTYTQSESGSARFSEACLIFPVYPLSRVLLSRCPGENEGSGQRRERRKYPSVGRGSGLLHCSPRSGSASRARALCADPFQST